MTEVGIVLQKLGYREEYVKRFDDLAKFLTLIPMTERREYLTSLIWYFDFKVKECDCKRFDEIIAEENNKE